VSLPASELVLALNVSGSVLPGPVWVSAALDGVPPEKGKNRRLRRALDGTVARRASYWSTLQHDILMDTKSCHNRVRFVLL
jgi:hypothetical protein